MTAMRLGGAVRLALVLAALRVPALAADRGAADVPRSPIRVPDVAAALAPGDSPAAAGAAAAAAEGLDFILAPAAPAEAPQAAAAATAIAPARETALVPAREDAAAQTRAEDEVAGLRLFDGASARSVTPAPEPEPDAAPRRAWLSSVLPRLRGRRWAQSTAPGVPAFDALTARQLSDLSALKPAEADDLIGWLRRVDVPMRGRLPYPEDTTFSLELEFLANRQLMDADIEKLFPGDYPWRRLSAEQRQEWETERTLPRLAWKRARAFAVRRVKRTLPKGWQLTVESWGPGSGKNTLEIRTADAGGVYHENTQRDWADLVAGLRRVQEALPGGFFSAHLHIGRKSLTRKVGGVLSSARALDVDHRAFALVSLTFEGLWRPLMGHPRDRAPSSGYAPDARFLDPRHVSERGYSLSGHSMWLNLSWQHPTIENKSVTQLFRREIDGAGYLDADRLRQDLWPAFAAFDMVARSRDLPLASLGLPVAGGSRPTRKQLFRFLDLAYRDDAAGKAVALKKLTEEPPAALPPTPEERERRDARAQELERAYKALGLEIVYKLHAARDGWDETLSADLLARRGKLLRRLGKDLRRARLSVEDAQALFPPELREPLARAMRRQYPVVP